MAEQSGEIVLMSGIYPWIALGLILGLIVLFLPIRREWHFSRSRLIAASRERIWKLYQFNPDDADNAAMHGNTVAVRAVPGEPGFEEHIIDLSGGHGTHLLTARCQIVANERPARYATRFCEIDGKPDPFGPNGVETLELVEQPGGTLVTLSWHGETDSLWQSFALWRVPRRYLRRLWLLCEHNVVPAKPGGSRSLTNSLVLSALAIGSFALWFGWATAILLTVILVVHEYGHWLAMRLTGQPAPRMLLIPFFGGMAVANHPHKTQFDDAFCSLMGPGFSVLPCLVFWLGGIMLGLPDLNLAEGQSLIGLGADASIRETIALIAVLIAAAIGLLNAVQLLPVLPLDGGHILRSVIESLGATWARPILLGLAVLGIAGLLKFGDYILAAVLGLGALQAWYLKPTATAGDLPPPRPMGGPGLVVIGLGYGLTLAVHVGAVFYALNALGLLALWSG